MLPCESGCAMIRYRLGFSMKARPIRRRNGSAAMDDEFCHEMIRARLRLAGTSFSDIARELGITPASVSLVSQGLRRSRPVQQVIADKLGTTPERIWPERYEQEAAMKF